MSRVVGFLFAPVLCAASFHTLSSLPNARFTAMTVDGSGSIYVAGYYQTVASEPRLPGSQFLGRRNATLQ